jgi:S-adenosylmethionine:tRNA ribosyltransferase-isomerase
MITSSTLAERGQRSGLDWEGHRFALPAELEASVPPEARGLTRDAVRMLVSYRSNGVIEHTSFRNLPTILAPGDLLVVNVSATLAAEVSATDSSGKSLDLHFSTKMPEGRWTVELRSGGEPWFGAETGEVISLAVGATALLVAPFSSHPLGTRLWLAEIDTPVPLLSYLAEHGRPIQYKYVDGRWPISAYQNVWSIEPGSAEMPSAGRPFTAETVTRLVAGGVAVAPVLLHSGVASLQASEPPYPEYFLVPVATARQVNETRREGGRVVAVGTTVVRALESVVDSNGLVSAACGWTDLVVAPERIVRSIDGMLTGWHEPEASHLAMLEAVAGRELLAASYEAALAEGYLWHEFGDVHLILP